MENFNWEEFRGNKVVVCCDTEEKAYDFLNRAHELGAKVPFPRDDYDEFKENTCYRLEKSFFSAGTVYYGSLQSYQSNKFEIIKWELDAPKKFFYVAEKSAEVTRLGIIELTEDEHKVVQNFFSQMNSFTDDYCGFCGIGDDKFNTRKEAVDSLKRML